MDRLPDILGTLGIMGIGGVAIVAFQEVNMQEGIHYLKAGPMTDEWLIVAGKQQQEWRGRATAVRRSLGVVVRRQLQANGLGVCVAAQSHPHGDRKAA